MNTKLAVGVALTLIACVGVLAPTASASETHAANTGNDCVWVNEDGSAHEDIPACKRFINNITHP